LRAASSTGVSEGGRGEKKEGKRGELRSGKTKIIGRWICLGDEGDGRKGLDNPLGFVGGSGRVELGMKG